MNFCTKCGSLYSRPGTCNCYAHNHTPPAPTNIPVPLRPPSIAPTNFPPNGTGDVIPPPYETTCGASPDAVVTTYTDTQDGTTTWVNAEPVDPNAPVSVYFAASRLAELKAQGLLSSTGGSPA